MDKTRVRGPSLHILLAKCEGYNGAKGDGVRFCTDGADHENPSSYAGNQAGTTTSTTSLVTASNAPGGVKLGGCGRGDDDDPRKPSKPYLKSTHDESDSSPVPSDNSKGKRREVARRKYKRRMSRSNIPILDRDISGEDSVDSDDMDDAERDMALSNLAAAADPPPLSNSPSPHTSEASQPGQIPSIASLSDNTALSNGVATGTEPTGNWLIDQLDNLGCASPPRAYIDENERLRRHSITTPIIEQPTNSAEPARLPSLVERYLENGHHPREVTPYPSMALEEAGRQHGMPSSAELDGGVSRSIVPGSNDLLGPIDIIPVGRVSKASDSPSHDAAFPGPPGHRRHTPRGPLSCSIDHGANDNTSEGHRGRSRLCGLPTSRADVCEESQSRRGWRASEQVPASIITEEQPAHQPWIDEKRPNYYLRRSLDASVGYGACPNSSGSPRSGVPCDHTQDDKAPAEEETILPRDTPDEPTEVTSNDHTPASTPMLADTDDITTENYEQALSPDPGVAATTDVPRYQLQDYSSPTRAHTPVGDGTQEVVAGTLDQVASQTRGSGPDPDLGLRNTQVVDFALNPSMNSRDIALPPVNRVSFDSDESWDLGIPFAEMIQVERVGRSSHTGPWARPPVVMRTEAPPLSSSESATLGSEMNAIGPDVRATTSVTGANTTAPESTILEGTQNTDRASRRRVSTNMANRRRSLLNPLSQQQ